jgi:hypothetical protein
VCEWVVANNKVHGRAVGCRELVMVVVAVGNTHTSFPPMLNSLLTWSPSAPDTRP